MEVDDVLLTAEEVEKLLGGFRICGRPNYQNKSCGLRTYTGLPCTHHVTDADREAQALVRMVGAVANTLYQQQQARHEKFEAQEIAQLREDLREAEARAGMQRYSQAEINAVADRKIHECGRPTKTYGDRHPCTLAPESFAPACKWHLEPWEWNMHRVAERAFLHGMEQQRVRDIKATEQA